jgi:hypothetical protein
MRLINGAHICARDGQRLLARFLSSAATVVGAKHCMTGAILQQCCTSHTCLANAASFVTPTTAGACKILFQLPLIYFILIKYVIACGLTVIARESITAVAWDSAGGHSCSTERAEWQQSMAKCAEFRTM